MNYRVRLRALALAVALALLTPVAACAEELGEMDLYDPSIHVGEALPAATAAEDDLSQDPVPAEAEEAPVPEAGEAPEAEGYLEAGGATGETAPEAAAEADGDAAVKETPTPAPEGAEPIEAGRALEDAGDEAVPETAESTPEDAEASQEAVEEDAVDADATLAPAGEVDAKEASDAPVEPADRGLEGDFPEGEGPADIAAAAAAGEDSVQAAENAEAAAEPNLRLGLGETFALDGAALLGGAETAAGYQSDRPDVASVDPQTGVVAANGLGTATISVAGSAGGTARYVVAVLNAPASLAFPAARLYLGKGERALLAAQLPENSAAASITYASSKTSVVQVDAYGNLYAKKKGTAVITAKAYNGAKASCKVTVRKAPSKVTLSAKKLVLCLDETRQLTAKLPKSTASAITWESGNPAVVTVDAAGGLRGVSAGTALVTVRTFNGKKAACAVTVLDGRAPTALSLGASTVTLGVKEKLQIGAALGEGEAAAFAYSTSKKKVATVSSSGLITAKKAGSAKITVKTHNGLKATLKVKVVKAPSKVALSASKLAIGVGDTVQLAARVPSGAASAFSWASNDASVASVDGAGFVTALKAGSAVIRVSTYNGKTASCKVTVSTPVSLPTGDADAAPALSAAEMAANLRASSALGAKREAIANVAELLMNAGFEPAFAAGMGANIYSEGTYGMFESSKYIANYLKRPRYFCYMDGGDYYTLQNGEYVLTAVYLSQEEIDAYAGEVEARLRFGEENYYRDNYSGKYVWNVDLNALEALMGTLAAGSWQGKFGLGITQWTGGRTKTLVSFYRKQAGEGNPTITKEQAIAAENEMILYDLQGSYKSVYNAWKNANAGALNNAEAARSAGALICTKYEIPADKETKAITRGERAANFYQIMIGG